MRLLNCDLIHAALCTIKDDANSYDTTSVPR